MQQFTESETEQSNEQNLSSSHVYNIINKDLSAEKMPKLSKVSVGLLQ